MFNKFRKRSKKLKPSNNKTTLKMQKKNIKIVLNYIKIMKLRKTFSMLLY